jgi:hypothetical protein
MFKANLFSQRINSGLTQLLHSEFRAQESNSSICIINHNCKIRVNLRHGSKPEKPFAQHLRHGPVDGLHPTETKAYKSAIISLT